MDPIVDGVIDEAETEDVGDELVQADDATNINRSGTTTDGELKAVLKDLRTSTTVVGRGGASDNTVNRMHEEGIKGAKLVVANTDV